MLRVEASFEAGSGGTFTVEPGAEPFVRDVVALDRAGAVQAVAERRGGCFQLDPCAAAACRVRYVVALREAARARDDVDLATEEGLVLEAPPATWLLAPSAPDRLARARVRVTPGAGARFVTGLVPSPEEPGAWDTTLDDLVRAPYSAFGPLRTRVVTLPTTSLELAIAPGTLAVGDAELEAWTRRSASAVAGYFGRFPLPGALVLVVPGTGAWVGLGRTLAGGGGAVFVRVGEEATPASLGSDWVLVHEMIHLAFPSVAKEHDWAEEGLATYVEPIARARAGLLSPEAAWSGLVRGLPNGLPREGDRGLDLTPTWGRTYWGGALFWLLADVAIRKASGNARGLEHALRGLVAHGATNATRRHLDEALALGDRSAGVSVLVPLHAAMGSSPHPVDLRELFRELGLVAVAGGGVTFDDAAPSAAIRRAITARD